MPDIKIERTQSETEGRYSVRVAGIEEEGELTYVRRGADLVIAHHTFAPPSMRGTGAALKLVERLVADARAEGFKIKPTCSYIVAQAKRHPEWADVMVG